MRTYLVTGGAGFIGSNYIHYMFKKYGSEIRIINVDALTYAGNLENLRDIEKRDNYTFIRADICDKEAIGRIFAENDIDRVVHFAAESHVDRSIKEQPGRMRTAVTEKGRDFYMSPRMRYMVPWKVTANTFMRRPPMRPTVPTRPARPVRTCL